MQKYNEFIISRGHICPCYTVNDVLLRYGNNIIVAVHCSRPESSMHMCRVQFVCVFLWEKVEKLRNNQESHEHTHI